MMQHLATPNYTVHVGSGKDHAVTLSTWDRDAAFHEATFQRALCPESTTVLVEVTS